MRPFVPFLFTALVAVSATVAQLSKILGTESESLSAVQDILAQDQNVDAYELLVTTSGAKKPEVIDFLLTKSLVDPDRRRLSKLDAITFNKVFEGHQLQPEAQKFQIAATYIEHLPRFGNVERNFPLVNGMSSYVISAGNVALFERMVKAGFPLPDTLPLPNIKKEHQVEMLQFFSDNGFDFRGTGLQATSIPARILGLFDRTDFCTKLFNQLFEKGLRVEYIEGQYNWLELAIDRNRFDLAEVAWNLGFHINRLGPYIKVKGFARYILHPIYIQKAALLLLAREDPNSSLFEMNREVILNHLIRPELFDAEIEDLAREMHHKRN